MNKSAFIRARVEPTIKEQAESILLELGITPTQAINMLYKYLVREQEWPISLKIPNSTSLKTFKDTDNNLNLVICKDTKEMFSKLGI